jgi:hypothetical protein
LEAFDYVPWLTDSSYGRPNRGVRFLNFMTYFPPNSKSTIDYVPDITHNDNAMFGSEAGVSRLLYVDLTPPA